MKKDLYNYNIGHKPFPKIHGGALETTDDGGYTYDENDEDDNVYLPTGKSYGDWYEREGNNFIMHNRFGDDYTLIYNPETKTFDYDTLEGETMDIIPVVNERLPYLEYDDDDKDEIITADQVRKMIDKGLINYDKSDLRTQFNLVQAAIDTTNKIRDHNQKIVEDLNILLTNMTDTVKKDQKRTMIKLKLDETSNPSKLKHEVNEMDKIIKDITQKIKVSNYQDPKLQKRGLDRLNEIDKDTKLRMLSMVFQRSSTYNTDTKQAQAEFISSGLMDSIYPLLKVSEDKKQIVNKEILEINEFFQELKIKFNKFKKDYDKDQTQSEKKLNEELIDAKRKLSKFSKDEKLEKEIEERKLRQAEEAKLAQPIEPEEPISKAKAKKNLAKAKKSDEEKEFEVIKNYAMDRIERINPEFTGEGKPLETFFTGLGESIIQHVAHDNSKVYDNEFNDLIPDKDITFDNGIQGTLKKACTIDLYSAKSAIEIKNYKEYNIDTGDQHGNTDSAGDPSIPLQYSKYEGTKYFRPLYFSDGTLWNIELVEYQGKKVISRTNILPDNPEGRRFFTIYRLDDGLYKFDPKEHDSINVQYDPIKNLKTPQDKQLYSFTSMNLNSCMDHNGRSSFNVRKYLKKIKI
jgi:hypothetical protein